MKLGYAFALLFSLTTWTSPVAAQVIGQRQSRLSAGTPVLAGELDAVVALPGCSGTLIANSLVLTAAHCVCPHQNDAVGCAARRDVTFTNVFPVDNPATPVDESKARTNVTVGGAVRVHPEYAQREWLREDYAVVQLDQPITALALVAPQPVEAPYITVENGESLTLVGYGLTGAGCRGPGQGKQKMIVPVDDSSWGGILFRNPALHSCPGDSGGPVLNSRNRVVGVASWGDQNTSTYRPTSYAYNWIMGLQDSHWSSCAWVPIEAAGKNSHEPLQYCPSGAFLTVLDLDGNRDISANDAPVVGQARCCKLAGAENASWSTSTWAGVEKAGINSYGASGDWCPVGTFITGIDLDNCLSCDPRDSPVIGQVQCSRLAGAGLHFWGSSYWMPVGRRSHQAGDPWCLDGAFITQLDLDREGAFDPHDSPIVGRAKCSAMRPATLPVGAMEVAFDRAGSDYKHFDLAKADPALCRASCAAEAQCKAWTYVNPGCQGPNPHCWLKTVSPSPQANACTVSGLK